MGAPSLSPAFAREERATRAKLAITRRFSTKQQAFLDFVLARYVGVAVEELDREKLTPLLLLMYQSVPDAIVDLGGATAIGQAFVGFQKYLYQSGA